VPDKANFFGHILYIPRKFNAERRENGRSDGVFCYEFRFSVIILRKAFRYAAEPSIAERSGH
jgi:hypothetical protein